VNQGLKSIGNYLPPVGENWVFANLVAAADGSTTFGVDSTALSSPRDRSRFHELRALADSILIGGNTARTAPYAKTSKPLFVLTRSNRLPTPVSMNVKARALNLEPAGALEVIYNTGAARILMEGGPGLLKELLTADLLDCLFLTITNATPNQNQINLKELIATLHRSRLIKVSEENFLQEDFYIFSKTIARQ
jgi:riboflavin biosynthesis pyrimidine reductase